MLRLFRHSCHSLLRKEGLFSGRPENRSLHSSIWFCRSSAERDSGTSQLETKESGQSLKRPSQNKSSSQDSGKDGQPYTWRDYVMFATSIVGFCATAYYHFDSKKTFDEIQRLVDRVAYALNRGYKENLAKTFLPKQEVPVGSSPRRTLVLDLDETLVYSVWKPKEGWKTLIRPGAQFFLEQMHQLYEIVLFTSSVPEYVDPIVHQLDTGGYISHCLYRDCTYYEYGYLVKDLSRLNRDLSRTIIIDNEPQSFHYQPLNGIAVSSWKGNEDDRTLFNLIPLLEYIVRENVPDARITLEKYRRGELVVMNGALDYNSAPFRDDGNVSLRRDIHWNSGEMKSLKWNKETETRSSLLLSDASQEENNSSWSSAWSRYFLWKKDTA